VTWVNESFRVPSKRSKQQSFHCDTASVNGPSAQQPYHPHILRKIKRTAF
jgi:hypothetical protein